MHYFRLLASGETFANTLSNELESLGLRLGIPDHLCFRVATLAEYQSLKAMLLARATLLTEAEVNGRPICTFRLPNEGFQTRKGPVEILELPAPKPGVAYPTGFEHAEYVISETFEEFQRTYPHLGFAAKTPQPLNSELVLETRVGNVKFHHSSLERVIEIEEAPLTDLVFDFDGTLIDSRREIYRINAEIFTELCERPVTLAESEERFASEFAKLFVNFDVSCEHKKLHGVKMWSELALSARFDFFPGTIELLHSLKEMGFRLHIWTARDSTSTARILKRNGLDPLFDTISCSSGIEAKPSVAGVSLDWRNARPHSLLMIGDSPTDIHGARNIGAIAAAALWDLHACERQLTREGAELFFRKPEELVNWLVQNGKVIDKQWGPPDLASRTAAASSGTTFSNPARL